jgi:hypothetical protein
VKKTGEKNTQRTGKNDDSDPVDVELRCVGMQERRIHEISYKYEGNTKIS